jgi:hypothetical protein
MLKNKKKFLPTILFFLNIFYLKFIKIDFFYFKLKLVYNIQLILLIRFILFYFYCIIYFIFFILNLDYFLILDIFQNIFLKILNNSVCLCMESDTNMSISDDSESMYSSDNDSDSSNDGSGSMYSSDNNSDSMSDVSDIRSSNSSLDTNASFSEYCLNFLKNPDDALSQIDVYLKPGRDDVYFISTYYLGAPYIKGINNLSVTSKDLLNENTKIIENLGYLYDLMNYKNLPQNEVQPLFINKSQYLSIFNHLIDNINLLLNIKYASNIKFITIFEEKNTQNFKIFNNILDMTYLQKINLKETKIPKEIYSYLPLNVNIKTYLNNDLHVIDYLLLSKEIAINNCNLINTHIVDDSVDFIVDNQIPLNFELIEFEKFLSNQNNSKFKISSLSDLKDDYIKILNQNNFLQQIDDYYFDSDKNKKIKNGFFDKKGFEIRN